MSTKQFDTPMVQALTHQQAAMSALFNYLGIRAVNYQAQRGFIWDADYKPASYRIEKVSPERSISDLQAEFKVLSDRMAAQLLVAA